MAHRRRYTWIVCKCVLKSNDFPLYPPVKTIQAINGRAIVDPNFNPRVFCDICHCKMLSKVTIDAFGQKQYMTNNLYCPHIDKVWHKQAVALTKEIKETSSAKLAVMMKEELDDIIENQHMTKSFFKEI